MFKSQNNGKSNLAVKLESVLGNDTEVGGSITCHGTLRLDGRVEGDINAEVVMVGESASVQGDIEAKTIIVGGKVNGNITAESIELKPKSQVFGDLKAHQLSVAEGAIFQGSCSMMKEKNTDSINLDHIGVSATS